MTDVNCNLFTAARIAGALGLSRQAVTKRLTALPADGLQIVQGAEVGAWRLQSLPADLKEGLAEQALNGGFRSPEQAVSLSRAWTPPVPLLECAPEYVKRAEKLRKVLSPWLERMNDASLTCGEIEAGAVDAYACVFGKRISTRYVRKLLKRTVERDGQRKQWSKLELYLDERPTRKLTALPGQLPSSEAVFQPLLDELAMHQDRATLNAWDVATIWDRAFQILETEIARGESEHAAKRTLRKLLWRHAKPLACSENALRVTLDRKYLKWGNSGKSAGALFDGRVAKKGEERKPIKEEDLGLIAWYAHKVTGGRVEQARRELAEIGATSGLSEDALALVMRGPNRRIQNAAVPMVRMMEPLGLGENPTPSMQRLYDNLYSCQVVSADDFTLPLYFSVPDGKGWFKLTRGQCLLFVCARSLCIIAWSLQPGPYETLAIRSGMNSVCLNYAVPDVWQFENGLWRRGKIVKGTAPLGWRPGASYGQVKTGWEQLGVIFNHTTEPRAKIAERAGGLLQNLMERFPGYCGRNERIDCPEETKRHKQAVEAKREHPDDHFYSFERWDIELARTIEKYNRTPQHGTVLQGLSPEEALYKFRNEQNPPMRLGPTTWHLGCHYVQEYTPKDEGIVFEIGNKKFKYFNERLGRDRYRKILIWFDPQNPDLIAVTDLNQKNPYLVPIHNKPDYIAAYRPAGSPEVEAYRAERAKAQGYSRHANTIYRTFQTKYKLPTRINVVNEDTANLAQTLTEQRKALRRDQRAGAKKTHAIENQARALGIPVEALNDDPGEGLRMIADALREHEKEANL